jgi:hypothetical protein
MMEYWNVGILECWNIGGGTRGLPIIPLFHRSNIPFRQDPPAGAVIAEMT